MISLSDGQGYLVGCLDKQPLMLFQDNAMIIPAIEKNSVLPMKPIQRLSSVAEQNGIIALAHGNRCLEFAKLKRSQEGPSIQRIYQATSIAYEVVLFEMFLLYFCRNCNSLPRIWWLETAIINWISGTLTSTPN